MGIQTERRVHGIYRYPIKGLSPEPLGGVDLEAGQPFPFDRVFALVRPGMPIDPAAPRWMKKGAFLMLMLDESLARVHTRLDVDTLELTLHSLAQGAHAADGECLLRADLRSSAGRAAVESFFRRQVPQLDAPPRLVHAPDGHFMDKPDSVLSCINLATLRSLEAEWRESLHPLRFRANFYIDGVEPWAELDWVGRDIQLGSVCFRVDRRNGRCGATNVNPITGERDRDIPGALRRSFGHKDLGVYLVALTSGRVAVGDEVRVCPREAPTTPLPPALEHPSLQPPARRVPRPPEGDGFRFICRGCYYVYVEGAAEPRGGCLPAFDTLGGDWRCPDCGTTARDFIPYRGERPGAE
ncbi:MAG TPA: MOSC domain-containing protein [Polyangiaceae bacterium]|nr:MOSC domain-containing protein [Polyangiaceae bacterium]